MMADNYLYLAVYGDDVGVFAAQNISEALDIAWQTLKSIRDDADRSALLVRPATPDDIETIEAESGYQLPDGLFEGER